MLLCGMHSREPNGTAIARSSSRMDESDIILNCLANRRTWPAEPEEMGSRSWRPSTGMPSRSAIERRRCVEVHPLRHGRSGGLASLGSCSPTIDTPIIVQEIQRRAGGRPQHRFY